MPDPLLTMEVPRFARAHDYVGVWAIEPTRGAGLWDLARRIDLGRHVSDAAPPKVRAQLQTVKAGNNQQVAVVILTGPLMKSVSSLDEGGTSTVNARREIRKAAADPDVSAILLAIDSPGGTMSGTADLAAEVAAAATRKPVWAQIEDLGASAAYWVASQAGKIFANNRTALVGSIGTLAVVYDLSGAAEAVGIKTLVFGTGPLKGTGVEGAPVTDDQQAYIRGLVDDGQVAFDVAVRKGRRLSEKQLEGAKTGGVFGATEALDRGLIDGIQSFEKTVEDLAAEARRQQRTSSRAATGPVPQRSRAMKENGIETAGATAVATPPASVADAVAAGIKQAREAAAAEVERTTAIQATCKAHPDIAAKAIRDGWTAEKAENAALKASLANGVHPAGPHLAFGAGKFRLGGDGGKLGDGADVNIALEAGLRLSLYGQAGASKIEKDYRPEVLQAAHENFRQLSLQQLFLMAAAANGYPVGPGARINKGNCTQVLQHAFGRGIDRSASMPSQISMSGILGNVANKELLAGYIEEDTSWMAIAQVRSVSNFQQHTSYRMLDDMEYEELGPGGEIKHATASQESYTRQAKTYARMFCLTRTSIINDDLGAFADLRTRLGRGSSKKFSKVFWTEFLSDASTFWSAARTNYIEGATTNLGVDGIGLGLGVSAFRKMTSPSADGSKHINADTQNPVGSAPGGRPEILLVPPELEGAAEALFKNQNLGQVATSSANIHANKYRPVVAWQLSNSAYAGNSTTAWYLLSNPSFLAPVVVSFLNGMMAPTVDSDDMDFDQLGVQFRGYHDFGADQAEYLAGLKSKGAA